jgi:hypothetical protein
VAQEREGTDGEDSSDEPDEWGETQRGGHPHTGAVPADPRERASLELAKLQERLIKQAKKQNA